MLGADWAPHLPSLGQFHSHLISVSLLIGSIITNPPKDVQIEAQRHSETCPKPHSQSGRTDLNQGLSDSRTHTSTQHAMGERRWKKQSSLVVNMGLCAKSKARDERQPWDSQESEMVQAENVSRGSSQMPGPGSVDDSAAVGTSPNPRRCFRASTGSPPLSR